MNPAILALEDGTVFEGRSFGAPTERSGEVVFNTALTGYQEVFTDPSYAGQIVCLTYPHIGNVGANLEDEEAKKPHIESLIVREFSQIGSNWRSAETAQLYLNRHKIPVIWDIDTRALVRHIRKLGALRGVVSTDGTPADQLIHEAKQLPSMAGQELASRVSCAKTYMWNTGSIDLADEHRVKFIERVHAHVDLGRQGAPEVAKQTRYVGEERVARLTAALR